MEAKKVLMVLAILLVATIVTAGVVTYLSNTVNATATVSSPLEVQATASVNGEEQALDAITAYGGETIVLLMNTENLSSVAQTCDLTITATPAIETTSGTLTTEIIKTVELDAYANENNTKEITLVPEYVGTTSIDIVCNVPVIE
jgi:P2-related tail formation protein